MNRSVWQLKSGRTRQWTKRHSEGLSVFFRSPEWKWNRTSRETSEGRYRYGLHNTLRSGFAEERRRQSLPVRLPCGPKSRPYRENGVTAPYNVCSMELAVTAITARAHANFALIRSKSEPEASMLAVPLIRKPAPGPICPATLRLPSVIST